MALVSPPLAFVRPSLAKTQLSVVPEAWVEPGSQRFVPASTATQRPRVVGVLGSSGAKASWQGRMAQAMVEHFDVIRWDVASGGCVAGMIAAAGVAPEAFRAINAGVPSHEMLMPVPGLSLAERMGLDLGGRFSTAGVATWLGAWLRWAGIETWHDFRYRPGEARPRDAEFRVGVSIVMWEAGPGARHYSAAELLDPAIIHAEFRRQYFGRNFPLKKFKQIWIPDDVHTHFPWMADDILNDNPADWAAVSCSQWPAALPKVLQNPDTGNMIFLADGGHITNQPSRFNDGNVYHGDAYRDYPLVNPRLTKFALLPGDKHRQRTNASMPGGYVLNFAGNAATRISILKLPKLTVKQRDAQYMLGLEQGRALLPDVALRIDSKSVDAPDVTTNITLLDEHEAVVSEAVESQPVSVARLHLFRLIAAADPKTYGQHVRYDMGWQG